MDLAHIQTLADRYDHLLQRVCPTEGPFYNPSAVTLSARIAHLRWMLSECTRGTPRAVRWLGFVEGVMVQLGILTVDEILAMDVASYLEVLRE